MILNTSFGLYCAIVSIISILLNLLFLLVTKLKRVEGFQEVLVFMRNIAVGYILMSLCLVAIAPQQVVVNASIIFIPHGLLAQADSVLMHGLASLGCGIYLYTVFSFMVMFLYRYNVTCKTSMMSSVFSRRNITTFLLTAGIFCVIQSVLFYYSAVDATYLSEKLNRTRDIDSILAKDQNLQRQLQNQADIQQQQQLIQAQTGEVARPQTLNGMEASSVPQKTVGIFGIDYSRNPMVFLSAGIFAVTNVISSVIILVASLVVACKLRGRQEAMSEQSHSEHQKLTNVLILDAYIPVLMALCPAVNFVFCIFQQDYVRFQEFFGILVLAPIPALFPLMNVFLVPELRNTAFQVVILTYWRNKRAAVDKERKENSNQAQEQLNEAQVSALKNMTDRAGVKPTQ
ncbi:unnamed protein product [Bursaphelenchus xylophilus]|uniref:(pine wood nematode) hypothetical protein n=1 Tax=Bursaphelenchus xylophilus TaxID=6326 RepID=A0A1I7RNN0_BURXY|nr:unnamed protein product [Bursaphelenchus xylophilus]CAG9124171.1 unnamed protein product [Bursaphelenchus xylophilus]